MVVGTTDPGQWRVSPGAQCKDLEKVFHGDMRHTLLNGDPLVRQQSEV